MSDAGDASFSTWICHLPVIDLIKQHLPRSSSIAAMFKASTRHNIQAGPSTGAGEVKQHSKAKGKADSKGPYEHRLNL